MGRTVSASWSARGPCGRRSRSRANSASAWRRRTTHSGRAAAYGLQALDAGLISLVFSNASPAMPPWGARTALLGTNPFAAGAPAGRHPPFLLDMSPAVAARGKIRRAERRGEKITLGYALDAARHPTRDPEATFGSVEL